ncbi:hypothetical protein K523DRAFT_326420, partial [Schizophyllum commune Tattone D]
RVLPLLLTTRPPFTMQSLTTRKGGFTNRAQELSLGFLFGSRVMAASRRTHPPARPASLTRTGRTPTSSPPAASSHLPRRRLQAQSACYLQWHSSNPTTGATATAWIATRPTYACAPRSRRSTSKPIPRLVLRHV